MDVGLLTYQIALTKIKGVGPVLARNLLAYFGGVEPVFKESARALSAIQGIGGVLAGEIVSQRAGALERALKEIDFISKKEITPVFFTDKIYPYRLKECVDAPLLLYVRGKVDFNLGKYVALVGTRKMTAYGKGLCCGLISDLAQNHSDLTIVSGLAYGVDVCAHKSAMEHNLRTIGVVAHGLDTVYPSAHYAVADRMLDGGCILSEYSSGTPPDAPNFVQRNRIVAGMCDAVVVVESAKRGGALITAEFANSYNRDVFTFPGRVGDLNSEGCNGLITANKAALIQSAGDLERLMNWDGDAKKQTVQQTIGFDQLLSDEQKIVALLQKNKETHINVLAMQTNLPVAKMTSLLIKMEFAGLVACLPGNVYRLVK